MELAASEPYEAYDNEYNDGEEVDYIDDVADDNDENTSFLGYWVRNICGSTFIGLQYTLLIDTQGVSLY